MTYDRSRITTASSAQADLLCPGRFAAQALVPEEKESQDAAHGRAIHRALATWIIGPNTTPALTGEQLDTFDACQKITAEMVSQFFGMDAPAAIERCWREKPIVINIGGFQHGATPDVIYRYGTKALILEYKTLAGELPAAPANMQLRDQVVVVSDWLVTVDEIGVAVIQPLVTHKPELCVYTRDDIARATAELFDRVQKSHDPNANRVAGEVQCEFCRAKAICVEYQKWAGSQLPAKVDLTEVSISNWTPEQCLIFVDTYPVWEKWIELGKNHLKQRLQADPASVPGLHLKPGNVQEKITNPQEVYERFEASGGSLDKFMDCIGVYKGKLKDGLREVTGAKGRKLDEMLDKLIEGCVESKQNAPSLERDK